MFLATPLATPKLSSVKRGSLLRCGRHENMKRQIIAIASQSMGYRKALIMFQYSAGSRKLWRVIVMAFKTCNPMPTHVRTEFFEQHEGHGV